MDKTVIFHQNLSSYCGPPLIDPKYFRIELALIGRNLTVREIFNPLGERITHCVCSFRINGSISFFNSGRYNLTFLSVFQGRVLKSFEININ
jgi:hypothetical protein